MTHPIHFKCPCCAAEHYRGFVDGVRLFRCLNCGYQGFGFHPNPVIDGEIYAMHVEANEANRAAGVEEAPLGVDPRDFAS